MMHHEQEPAALQVITEHHHLPRGLPVWSDGQGRGVFPRPAQESHLVLQLQLLQQHIQGSVNFTCHNLPPKAKTDPENILLSSHFSCECQADERPAAPFNETF